MTTTATVPFSFCVLQGVVGLVTCWNSVNVEAKKLQSEMLTRLASVQDARLKTVETWLEHLEEEQAKDATLRPEVLTVRLSKNAIGLCGAFFTCVPAGPSVSRFSL